MDKKIYNNKILVMNMTKKIYQITWRNKWLTSGATSIDDFIHVFEEVAKQFREWKELGVQLQDDGGVADDYATFTVDDMDAAIKAGFIYCRGDDREKQFLVTLDGEEIEIPKEKLKTKS